MDLDNIREFTLLSTLSPATVQEFLVRQLFRIVHYKKGQFIHFDGDLCECLELIITGTIIVERIDEYGSALTIGEFHPNDILGGNLLFSKNPHYPMTVWTKTAVTILEIKKDTLLDLCSASKEFLNAFLEHISNNTVLLGNKIKHYIKRTLRERICAYLKQESQRQNSTIIELRTTKSALAEGIGVQRTSLSRELQRMKQAGLITYNASTIEILDLEIIK